MKFATKPYDITHLTLGMLLHYLEKLKLKIQIFCTDFNSSTRVTVYAVCICVFFIKIRSSSLNIMLIIDKHCSDVCCDEFSMAKIDRKSK